MKTIFRLSILLNGALLSCLVLVLVGRPGQRTASVAGLQPESASFATGVGRRGARAEVANQARSFRWSQLESADYRTYVANLRGIGCPEQTIRDIITADVGSLYRERIRTLEGKFAGTADDRSAVEGEIRAVRREKAWLLSTLLGMEPVPGDDSAEGVAADSAPRTIRLQEPRKVPVPLVFQPVDFEGAKLAPDQIQAIMDLRQRFIEEIGVQDPNDPAYRERWLRAQPQSDKELQGVIGLLAYRHFQVSARVAAASQGAPVSE